MRALLRTAALLAPALLSACSPQGMTDNFLAAEAKVTETTRSYELLKSLPPPDIKAAVAVYNFEDQTGQLKPPGDSNATEYSSAVTKGGLAILNNALLATGNKRWFTVVERGGLRNVLQERKILLAMSKAPLELPAIVPAGLLIEGGIIGYDSNTLTGGAAANYFGIGGNTEYRSDRVSVYLRAVHILTGEVLLAVTSTKTIYSVSLQGNVFKYLTTDRILQAETGFTLNEPVQLAVRQAIETAVYSMVMEGVVQRLWDFQDPRAGQPYVEQYLARKANDSFPAEKKLQQELQQAQAPQPVSDAVQTAPAAPPPPAPAPAAQAVAPMRTQPGWWERMNPWSEEKSAVAAPAPETPPAPKPVSQPTAQPVLQAPITRPAHSRALVKYLDDSRYADRHAPAVCQEAGQSGACGK